jgi:sugar lactone lactonase YvrE
VRTSFRAVTVTRAVALALALLPQPAGAVTTREWSTATYKEFDEGEGEHALVASIGEVVPGTDTKRVDLETQAIWTAVRAPDGTIYAGAVEDGTVFAITGGVKRKVATLDKETPWIGALAVGPDGLLYAGTLGTGSVVAIDPKSGKTSVVAKLDGATHVWSLAFVGKTLYAGTGPSGKLYAIDVPGGKPRLAWEGGDKHLLSMVAAPDGGLWIGTSDEAILFRYDPKSEKARAVADFAGTEIKAVALAGDSVVVAANEFDAKTGTAPSLPPAKGPKGTAAKPPEAGSAPGADKPADAEGPPREGARKGKGALFRVDPDGRIEQLHALTESYFTSLAVIGDDVYAGAGAQGRIYEVHKDRSVVTAFDVSERQVTALIPGKDGLAFTTGDAGALYLATGPAHDARYASKVFDALFPAQFGNLVYRGSGVSMETRSGNTAKPGKGWSGWERLGGADKAGGDALAGRIVSPGARFFQYRATFSGSTAVLREATVYYLPQNQRPRVTEVTVGEDGKRTPVTLVPGATKPRSPVAKIKWKVENPDEDELSYRIDIKPEGESEWRELPGAGSEKEPLTATSFDWNTEPFADGMYRLRVTASDRRANPRERALEDSYTTPAFTIDNGKPELVGVSVNYPTVKARAVDAVSRVAELAYQLDGGEWLMAYPDDGIFDDRSEAFTVRLPEGLKPGAHTLSLRAADEADNIGAASVVFRVAPRK